jgi:hypothetical protein
MLYCRWTHSIFFVNLLFQEGFGRLWRGTNAGLALAIPTVSLLLAYNILCCALCCVMLIFVFACQIWIITLVVPTSGVCGVGNACASLCHLHLYFKGKFSVVAFICADTCITHLNRRSYMWFNFC